MSKVVRNLKENLSFIVLATFCITIGVACTKNNNYYDDDDRTEIRLSSRVELSGLRLQDLQIEEGQSLSFFVENAGEETSVLYDNVRIIADGEGGFTYGTPMYYPTNGDNVNFYAVHPYSGNATYEQEITFNTQIDQSIAGNYLASDLLYAERENVARTSSAVSMLFTHKLAKLDFEIIQGEGSDISGLNMVTILSVSPTTAITVSTGDLEAASGTKVNISPYGLTVPAQGAEEVTGITAIIVPQSIPVNQRLFQIRLGNIDYYYTTNRVLNFESGKRYTLQLTINQAGIELESSITDWTDGGTITGDGSID